MTTDQVVSIIRAACYLTFVNTALLVVVLCRGIGQHSDKQGYYEERCHVCGRRLVGTRGTMMSVMFHHMQDYHGKDNG